MKENGPNIETLMKQIGIVCFSNSLNISIGRIGSYCWTVKEIGVPIGGQSEKNVL